MSYYIQGSLGFNQTAKVIHGTKKAKNSWGYSAETHIFYLQSPYAAKDWVSCSFQKWTVTHSNYTHISKLLTTWQNNDALELLLHLSQQDL